MVSFVSSFRKPGINASDRGKSVAPADIATSPIKTVKVLVSRWRLRRAIAPKEVIRLNKVTLFGEVHRSAESKVLETWLHAHAGSLKRKQVVLVTENMPAGVNAETFAKLDVCPEFLRSLIKEGVRVVGLETDTATQREVQLRIDLQGIERLTEQGGDAQGAQRLMAQAILDQAVAGAPVWAASRDLERVATGFLAGNSGFEALVDVAFDALTSAKVRALGNRQEHNQHWAEIIRAESHRGPVVAIVGNSHLIDVGNEGEPLSVPGHLATMGLSSGTFVPTQAAKMVAAPLVVEGDKTGIANVVHMPMRLLA